MSSGPIPPQCGVGGPEEYTTIARILNMIFKKMPKSLLIVTFQILANLLKGRVSMVKAIRLLKEIGVLCYYSKRLQRGFALQGATKTRITIIAAVK